MQFYTKKRRTPVINIISLIDIFCILLIFSLATTTFRKNEPVIKVDLPDSKYGKADDKGRSEPVVVYVSKDQKITVDGLEVPIAQLSAKMKELKPAATQGFVLKADTNIPLGFFFKISDASKDAGVENLNVQTNDPKTAP